MSGAPCAPSRESPRLYNESAVCVKPELASVLPNTASAAASPMGSPNARIVSTASAAAARADAKSPALACTSATSIRVRAAARASPELSCVRRDRSNRLRASLCSS